MTYYIYHIPGKKIGVTCDLNKRVTEQQGYEQHEYEILYATTSIEEASRVEIIEQKRFGYRVDETPYNKLKFNNMEMNINITEQTTTFPCPINKLKGQLMDNIGMKWETDHGEFSITRNTIDWIMRNVQISRYNDQRCYVYNKAFARYYDNNDAYASHDKLGGNLQDAHMQDQYNGKTKSGALTQDCGTHERQLNIQEALEGDWSRFDLIREWANNRGLYDGGDPKTQALKLVEEVGETCRAILKNNNHEAIDGIGDCVVVLTNLAELLGIRIEDCIDAAYNEIKDRTGKMDNGTFKKD